MVIKWPARLLRLVLLTTAEHLRAGLKLWQAAVTAYSPVRKNPHSPASGPAHSDFTLEVRGSLNSLCDDGCLTCGRGILGFTEGSTGEGLLVESWVLHDHHPPDSDTVHISPVLTFQTALLGL